MKKIVAIILGLFLFGSTLGSTALATFSDVPETHPFFEDIRSLEQSGIVNDDAFKPEAEMTRGEFARWLLKNTGFEGEDYKPKTHRRFLDVRIKGNRAAPYIYRLLDLGLFDNDKKMITFKPEEPITKKAALQWLFWIEGIPVPKIFDGSAFQATDVKKDSAVAPLVYKATTLGILSPGRVRITKKLSRAEAAHFLKEGHNSVPTLTVTIMPTGSNSDFEKNPKYEILNAAWERILKTYLRRDSVDRNKLVYAAIEGMVKELGDKHSDFERPGDNAVLDSLSGEVEGIGAVLQLKDEEIVIVTPIVGSPAEKAGLLPNDIITAVDDKDVKGMKLSAVAALIKGKKGTQVKVTIRRSGKSMNFTVTRDVVKIVSVLLERTSDNIAQVTLSNFGENTNSEFRTVVDQLVVNRPRGIVLDLRNNPGGFLNTAIQIAGHFIDKDKKVSTVRYPDREDQYVSNGKAELSGIKLIVLLNAGSASASEILAGALKDYDLATIIGEKSYGKGTVQEISDFTDGSSLKLTVAEWLTPSGHSIEKNGITPDIEVKITDADRAAKRDPQMERALVELRK